MKRFFAVLALVLAFASLSLANGPRAVQVRAAVNPAVAFRGGHNHAIGFRNNHVNAFRNFNYGYGASFVQPFYAQSILYQQPFIQQFAQPYVQQELAAPCAQGYTQPFAAYSAYSAYSQPFAFLSSGYGAYRSHGHHGHHGTRAVQFRGGY